MTTKHLSPSADHQTIMSLSPPCDDISDQESLASLPDGARSPLPTQNETLPATHPPLEDDDLLLDDSLPSPEHAPRTTSPPPALSTQILNSPGCWSVNSSKGQTPRLLDNGLNGTLALLASSSGAFETETGSSSIPFLGSHVDSSGVAGAMCGGVSGAIPFCGPQLVALESESMYGSLPSAIEIPTSAIAPSVAAPVQIPVSRTDGATRATINDNDSEDESLASLASGPAGGEGMAEALESNLPGPMTMRASTSASFSLVSPSPMASSTCLGATGSERLGFSYGAPHEYDITHCKWWGDVVKSLTGS